MNNSLLLQFLFLASSFFYSFVLLLLLWASQELTFPQGLLIKEGTVQCWKCRPSIILESTQQQYPFLITSCPYRHLFRAHSSLIPTAAVTDWGNIESSSWWSSFLGSPPQLAFTSVDLVTSGITLQPEAGKHALCLLAASTQVSVQIIRLCSLHPSCHIGFVS